MSDLDKFNTENFKAQFKKEGEYTGSGDFGSYEYIAKLLLCTVSDGRNRLLWLVLAPYAVSILKLNRDGAVALVTEYMQACHELNPCQEVLNKVEQYVDYAAQMGLKPPHLKTLQQNDPELFEIVQQATSK